MAGRSDHPPLAQHFQVTRYGWLADVQSVRQFAHVLWPLGQSIEQQDTGWVGECLANLGVEQLNFGFLWLLHGGCLPAGILHMTYLYPIRILALDSAACHAINVTGVMGTTSGRLQLPRSLSLQRPLDVLPITAHHADLLWRNFVA